MWNEKDTIDQYSMKQKEQVWISAEDLKQDEDFVRASQNEFFNLPILNDLANNKEEATSSGGTQRRDFLKYVGFSLGAASIAAACDTPIRKAIPYVNKPDTIVPGVASYYASSFVRSGDYCPILVKTREGRPIKIEGNTMSPLTGGGTSARAQASVLDLYDVARLRQPVNTSAGIMQAGQGQWDVIDAEIIRDLKSAGSIRIVRNSNISPSQEAVLKAFQSAYPGTKVVTYDPISNSAMLLANEKTFGSKTIPGYRFDKANLVVNFGADFLGTWLSPTEFAHQFSQRRKIKGVDGERMMRLIQLESNMSYTGSNADHRVLIKPSEQGLAIAKLHNAVAAKTGATPVGINGTLTNPNAEKAISSIADDLMVNRGNCIVLAGSNNTAEQCLVNAINHYLGNYGTTLDFDTASHQRQGIDPEMADLIQEMKAGSVDAILFLEDANPVYDHPMGADFKEGMSKVKSLVACTCMPSETQALCNYTCPTPHYLESWGDVHPKRGHYGIVQPTISPLFNTRPIVESLMIWAQKPIEVSEGDDPSYAFIKKYWEESIFPEQETFATFRAFWDSTLHDGFAQVTTVPTEMVYNLDVSTLEGKINRVAHNELEIFFYEPLGVGSGANANNPWLQEMPDPVTRVVWDNVVHIPIQWSGEDFEYFNGLDEDGLLVDLTVDAHKVRLPVVRQFGQMPGTVSVALGYGRRGTGKAGSGVGVDCYPMIQTDEEGNLQYFSVVPTVSRKVGTDKRFASVQHHHTMGVSGPDGADGSTINVDEKTLMTIGEGYQGALTKRSIFRHSDVTELDKNVEALKEERAGHQHLNEQTLYPDWGEVYGMGHHWGLSVDLTACIGCAACQVACVAENNVPIVGKVEVNRHHEMTWMRIDRYYYGDVESPNVVYQPMMCQHCDNAPCENVCPVAATNHSSEGLNQMAYNRCVGTRYCANNCPYKVRRFNWLDYNAADLFPSNENDPFDEGTPYYADNLTRMVLNPDVTVRARGVIEKCSMCVQRIQEGKLTAKREKRMLKDGDVKTACQTACPTGAIVFGDMNDHESQLHERLEDPKTYIALEETNVRSSVGYMMKVTNRSGKINSKEA